MSPTVPWVMSESTGVRGQTHSGLMCVCVRLTQAVGALVVLVSSSQLRHQLCAVVPSVISDDGGQLQHKQTDDAHIVLKTRPVQNY